MPYNMAHIIDIKLIKDNKTNELNAVVIRLVENIPFPRYNLGPLIPLYELTL